MNIKRDDLIDYLIHSSKDHPDLGLKNRWVNFWKTQSDPNIANLKAFCIYFNRVQKDVEEFLRSYWADAINKETLRKKDIGDPSISKTSEVRPQKKGNDTIIQPLNLGVQVRAFLNVMLVFKGWTQYQMADALNINRADLYYILNNQSKTPRSTIINKVCSGLNTTIDEIMAFQPISTSTITGDKLSAFLKQQMQINELSCIATAGLIGVSEAQIRHILNKNSKKPREDTISKVLKAFDASAADVTILHPELTDIYPAPKATYHGLGDPRLSHVFSIMSARHYAPQTRQPIKMINVTTMFLDYCTASKKALKTPFQIRQNLKQLGLDPKSPRPEAMAAPDAHAHILLSHNK